MFFASFLVHAQQIVITGLMDGTLSGGNPKAIELYVNGTINLGDYSLWKSQNGGAFSKVFDLSGTFTNRFVYLGGTANSGQVHFESVFGNQGVFSDVIYNSGINGNGDEGFQIVKNSDNSVVDQVWTTDTSDSYKDSYMKRKNNTGPDGAWVIENWTLAGNGALSGKDAANHATAFDSGSYTNSTFSTVDFNSERISIYPNPVRTKLFISGLNNSVQTTIIDMSGKLNLEAEVESILDVSSLKSGVYMLKIENQSDSRVFKIIKD